LPLAFDAHRTRICAAAAHAYERCRSGSYDAAELKDSVRVEDHDMPAVEGDQVASPQLIIGVVPLEYGRVPAGWSPGSASGSLLQPSFLGVEVAEGVLDLLDGSHPKFRAPFEPPAIRQRLRPNL